MILLILTALLSLTSVLAQPTVELQLNVPSDESIKQSINLSINQPFNYSITVNGEIWLNSAATIFRANKQEYSTDDGSLIYQSMDQSNNQVDSIGEYSTIYINWAMKSSIKQSIDQSPDFQTNFKLYNRLFTDSEKKRLPSLAWSTKTIKQSIKQSINRSINQAIKQIAVWNIRAIVFEQVYLTGVSNSQTDWQKVVSAFPSFLVPDDSSDDQSDLSYYQWAGQFFWKEKALQRFTSSGARSIYGGIEGAPLAFFNAKTNQQSKMAIDSVMMLSPLTQFMDASMCLNVTINQSNNQTSTEPMSIQFGLLGGLTTIPKGHTVAHIAYFDGEGFVNTVLHWGDILRTLYGKSRENALNDMTTQYLSKNVDRGAYYYFWNEPGTNFQQTMYNLKDESVSQSVNYRSWLTDSRWYQEDKYGGLLSWTPTMTNFPSGFSAVAERLGWGLVAHSRYFSPQTPYAKQNGGKYDFMIQNNMSLPNDPRFWGDLFQNSSTWDLKIYWQDWLYTVSDGFEAINTNVGAGQLWLAQMSQGAKEKGINIQYCMALARHALTSVQFTNVVQIRVSEDGMPGEHQWNIGESSLFAWALGVIPFADNYWSSEFQPGNPYYQNATEPRYLLRSALATFSKGPVAPGDGLGFSNVSLIMRSARADGLVLAPSQPLFTIDQWFLQAYNGGGDGRELMSTFTEINGLRWYLFVAVNLTEEIELSMEDLHITEEYGRRNYVSVPSSFAHFHVHEVRTFNNTRPLHIRKAGDLDFLIEYINPVLSNGMVLYGEESKWTRISEQRIRSLAINADSLVLTLIGGPGEHVRFSFASQVDQSIDQIYTANCQINNSGTAILKLNADGTSSCSTLPQSNDQMNKQSVRAAFE